MPERRSRRRPSSRKCRRCRCSRIFGRPRAPGATRETQHARRTSATCDTPLASPQISCAIPPNVGPPCALASRRRTSLDAMAATRRVYSATIGARSALANGSRASFSDSFRHRTRRVVDTAIRTTPSVSLEQTHVLRKGQGCRLYAQETTELPASPGLARERCASIRAATTAKFAMLRAPCPSNERRPPLPTLGEESHRRQCRPG